MCHADFAFEGLNNSHSSVCVLYIQYTACDPGLGAFLGRVADATTHGRGAGEGSRLDKVDAAKLCRVMAGEKEPLLVGKQAREPLGHTRNTNLMHGVC